MNIIIKMFLMSVLILIVLSCGGKVEKSWTITNFSQVKVFELKAKENKSYTSAIVLVKGNVDQNIYFRRNQFDKSEFREFSKDTTYIKSRYDFYGGEFKYQLLPSQAKGKISISITLL